MRRLLRLITRLPARSPNFWRFLRGFCAAYTLFIGCDAFSAGLKDDWFSFDLNALLAGLYCFLTLTSHSRVKQSHPGRDND